MQYQSLYLSQSSSIKPIAIDVVFYFLLFQTQVYKHSQLEVHVCVLANKELMGLNNN